MNCKPCLVGFVLAAALMGAEKPRIDYTSVPLSFEKNEGQAEPGAGFLARSQGYALTLDATGARFRSRQTDLRLQFENANRHATGAGESPLPGKANYFPTGDSKSWITNIPTYSRVRYNGVYPGVDVSFYGTANRLEYDFVLQPGSDPAQVQMKISGADDPSVSYTGELVLKGVRFLKPVAYQLAADGKTRESVSAGYRVEKDVVTFALGKYDHARALVIDPVVANAISYSQYTSQGCVGGVTVDAAGNSYTTGQCDTTATAFYVSKYSPSGAVIYTSWFGTGGGVFPYDIAVDSSGQAYITGQIYIPGSTIPATANAYQTTPGSANQQGFLAVLSADGASVPYCTYLSGSDGNQTNSVGVALDPSAKVYLTGSTSSGSFPTTAGAYQTTNPSGFQTGFVSKFDPTQSGAASLIYSTFLGSATNSGTYLNKIVVDYAGSAYLTAYGSPNYPVTPGAFQYTGISSGSGGAYVTKLNPTGTALVYSAYLGYGNGGACGIAVEAATSGLPSAYVTGNVSDPDFPTTAGAYQTSYASGFAVKLSGDGSSEIYSTFLSGPSGYDGNSVDQYPTLALPVGCASSCNAYISGRTTRGDFPLINSFQDQPPTNSDSAFVVELNSTGTNALLSSYLSGYTTGVYKNTNNQAFGSTPQIAVDSSGNIYVAGNTFDQAQNSNFPTTIPYTNGSSSAFLAKITTSANAGLTLVLPTSISFGNQPVGVPSSIGTARLSNYSSVAVTGLSIQTSSSVYTESDNCGGTIVAGGFCSLNFTFTPNSAAAENGSATITSSASNSPISIALTGSGYTASYVQVSSGNLAFNSQAVGTTSTSQTFTITNIGNQATGISTGFYNGTSFAGLNNCPASLAPGANCTESVTFSPSQPGYITQRLTVFYNDGAVNVALSGTGVVSGATTGLSLTTTSLVFAPQPTSTTSGALTANFINTGTEPIVINSWVASGNFSVSGYDCGPPPFQLNPQNACQVYVTFSPVTVGPLTGTLAINSSASGGPQSVSLSGTGVANTQTVEFYPSSSISFPDTPQGATSGQQNVYFVNTGSTTITIDRSVIRGDFSFTGDGVCEGTTVPAYDPDGANNGNNCWVGVQFTPTAVGARTGTITFIDSATGSPHVVTLLGTGITATGALGVYPASITFGVQPEGVTSGIQYIFFQDIGNTYITVNSATISGPAAADYSIAGFNWVGTCGSLPCTIDSIGYSGLEVQFTPTATGTRSATLTFSSSTGNQTASLTGTGVVASAAVGFTPTSTNLGPVVLGQSSGAGASYQQDAIFVRNVGTEIIYWPSNPVITGPNAADFSINFAPNCAPGESLPVNASCFLTVQFTPSIAGPESATITFNDTAGTQTYALSGTGVSATPTYTVENNLMPFNTQIEGTSSAFPYFYNEVFYDNAGAVTMGGVTVTGPFLIEDGCSGAMLNPAAGNRDCAVNVSFAPTAAGYFTGTLTFNDTSGHPLLPAVPLSGFSLAPTYSAYINPIYWNFVSQQVVGTTSGPQVMSLVNNGTTPFNVGTVNGTDFGSTPASAEFTANGNYGGNDECSGTTVNAGASCLMYITFTPNATGTRTGTINFPITYTNGTTSTITGNLSGLGVAERDSAVLTPPAATFVDQAVGVTTSYSINVALNNSGNLAFNVGTLSNTNSTEFSAAYDGCSGTSVGVGSNCHINVTFTPSVLGARSGTITFPVIFADGTTRNLTLPMNGKGVSLTKTVEITPANLNFSTEVQGATSGSIQVVMTNTGNQSLTIGTDAITTNSAEFAIGFDNCSNRGFNPTNVCWLYLTFTPSATATGTQTGVLTIADNATGGPHTIALSAIAITAAQQVVVSPGTLAFGSQPAGSTSSAQAFYITNQADPGVTLNSITLGGTNAADFSINNQCGGSLGGHSTCGVTVQFAPPSGVTGALTATVTENDSTGTHTVTLTGTAVTPGPAGTFYPASLSFAKQNVGSTGAAQNFSVTNTGSANLTISAVVSTNATEFPISANGCAGATLTPGQNCAVSVAFSPSLGGTRSGSIQVSDNAPGSPQSLAVTGTGYGIPAASYTPASLTFGNTNIGTTSAAQTIALKNTGTDTLVITGLAITGTNGTEFAQTNNCPASLTPAASCSISVTFDPAAAGSQTADVTVTNNVNNIAGSTQSVPLNGTGVAAPAATVSPNTLTFGSTNIGVTSGAQIVTLANSGSAPLTIAGIAITGADAADFAQTNNCGSSLAVAASCAISVTFKPTAAGTRTASVLVTDNAGNVSGSIQSATLTGTGTLSSALTVVSLSPSSGYGVTQTFSAVYSDPNGVSDLSSVRILFNTAVSGANACYVLYYPASNALYLENNADNGTVGPLTPGSSSSIANSQCTLAGAGSSVSVSGSNITVNFALTFSSSFAGTKNVYLSDNDSVYSSGWVQKGTWTTNAYAGPPTVVSLSPNSGTGLTQTFSAVYADPNGIGDLSSVRILINSAVNGVNGCYVFYYPASNALYLENNTDNGTVGPLTPGASSSISNSQCTLAGAGSSVSTSGNNMTVNFALTFASTFAGLKSVYLADNNATASSGWVKEGTYDVSVGPPTVVSLSPNSGTGLTQTFSAVYGDPNGASDLNNVRLLFNTTINGVNACYVFYYPASNALYLENNADNGTIGPLTPGSTSSISNSQCTLAGTGSSVSTSGDNLTVNFALTFSGSFSGSKNAYLSSNSASASSGWVHEGSWTP